MAEGLVSSWRFQTQEQRQILLMLTTGFFMGVFIATYQVTADSLFLNKIGEQLDKAFLVSGALGIITTVIFTFFQNWVKFTTLSVASILLICAFTFGEYILLHFGEPAKHNQYIFALYCMTGPITAVLFLSFWGVFGRLFNFRQSKRIIGWIDTGQLIAAIIATLIVIPFSTPLVEDTSNYLLICSIAIVIVAMLLIIIATSFQLSKNNPREFDEMVRKETRIVRLFKDGYIRSLGLFLLISMSMLMFGQFAFQGLVTEQYPDQRELTTFTSFFTGAVYGLSLILQTFVNSKVISNYGLRISLLILPLVVGVFAIGSVAMGISFGYEKSVSTTGFLYFFLFVALSRLFNWTLRDSLENPVFKLFFIPLDARLRFNVQSKVEGVMNEASRFIAGLLIFGLALIPGVKVIHISIIMILLTGLYLFIINKIYGGYRHKIREKLEASTEEKQERLERGFVKVGQRLEGMLSLPQPGKAVFSFKLLEKINAAQVSNWINGLMKNDDEAARHFAQERMNELKGLSVSDKYVIRFDKSKLTQSSGDKNILSKNDLELILQNGGDITKTRIQKLTRSTDPSDRHYAAELLLHTSKEEGIAFLMELLNDAEPKVRNTAIKTAIKKHNTEVINSLIENLAISVHSNQAMNALVLIGQESLPLLDSAFYRSGQNTQAMVKIIQVMGRIGGQKARDQLWNKIDYPNKVVVSQVLLALGESGFKAGISQMTRIRYAIDADIADIRWNLSAIQEVGNEAFSQQIKKALRAEIQNDIEHIYMLLAMLYDTRSIQLVKENIDSGTTDGITFAVELLDVFLSEQLKQRVIPILDDLSDNERISKLEDYFPRVKLDEKLVLKFIINRDFTQSNRWTKACVIFYIGMQRISDFRLDLIAQLFNPDSFIREVSAWALYQIDQTEYHKTIRRFGEHQKRELDNIVIHSKIMMGYEKVLFFLKISIFEDVPGLTLSHLADISTELNLKSGDVLTLDDRSNNNFYILVSGTILFYQRGELVSQFMPGQFIGEMLPLPNFVNTNLLKADSEVVILQFNKDQFYELLSDNVVLADKVIEFI